MMAEKEQCPPEDSPAEMTVPAIDKENMIFLLLSICVCDCVRVCVVVTKGSFAGTAT